MTSKRKEKAGAGAARPRTVTTGSGSLAQLVTRLRAVTIAKKLGVSEAMIRALSSGERAPSARMKARLLAVYGVPLVSWDVASTAGHEPATSAPATRPGPGLVGSSAEECEANVARLRHQAELLDRDPLVAPRDRTAAGAALNAALRHLSRLRGEDEITEARIARSAPYRRIVQTLRTALRPWPHALRAVADALESAERGDHGAAS